MKIEQERQGNQIILSLEGDLVGSYARYLQEELEALRAQGISHFIFDLTKVNSIDSIGIMVLGSLQIWNVDITYKNMSYHIKTIFALEQGGKYRELIQMAS